MKLAQHWLAAFLLCFLALAAAGEDLQLQQVVLLSRHGVRSPTNTHPPLAQVAAQPWPQWSVGPGDLTPRGAQLATLMGAFYRDAFAQQGLLAPDGCPRPDDVYVWSDVEERTLLTARALLDGMYPGCKLEPHGLPKGTKEDPLFHPTTTGICKVDGAAARNAILGRTGGDFNGVMKAYAEPFARLQSVLKCCAPELCASSSASCTLPQVPATITPDGKLQGPIPIASTATEVFLLEYGNGFPLEQVGWGQVDEPTLRYLLQLHDLQADLAERTLYPAQRAGSNLLDQVLATLRAHRSGKAAPRAKAPAGTRLVLFAGHDTNLDNLGGMLNLDWMLDGYQRNETPPAGALAFELLRGKTSRRYYVRLVYYAQTPTQMREATRLDAAHPPSRAEIALPGCALPAARAGSGMACPWPVFERLAAGAIDRGCVGSGNSKKATEPPEMR